MQNTRFNTLINVLISQFQSWLNNPWRRISLLIISLLSGIFLGTAIPTTTGQAAAWDVVVSAILVFFTEGLSRIVYQNESIRKSLWAEILNSLKIGLTYGLFLEAFKIGS